MKGPEREYRYTFALSLTSVLDKGDGQSHARATLPLRETPGTHFTEGWVGPQGRSGRVRKISPLPGFDPRTVQPVASNYTDWAIPGHQENQKKSRFCY
jgi:hypothetical protein